MFYFVQFYLSIFPFWIFGFLCSINFDTCDLIWNEAYIFFVLLAHIRRVIRLAPMKYWFEPRLRFYHLDPSLLILHTMRPENLTLSTPSSMCTWKIEISPFLHAQPWLSIQKWVFFVKNMDLAHKIFLAQISLNHRA